MSDLSYKHISGTDTAKYRYGFNNQENEDDLYGEGDAQVYEYRISNSRLGRFFSVDPLAPQYPYYSPYQFAGNMPIWAIELEGLEPSIVNTDADGEIMTHHFSNGTDVTLDPRNGDKIESDNGKITSFQKDWVTYNWNSQTNVFTSGSGATAPPASAKANSNSRFYFKKLEVTEDDYEDVNVASDFQSVDGKVAANAFIDLANSTLSTLYFVGDLISSPKQTVNSTVTNIQQTANYIAADPSGALNSAYTHFQQNPDEILAIGLALGFTKAMGKGGIGATILSKSNRLEIFKAAIRNAPTANNAQEAIRLINNTIDQVEDIYSGVPKNYIDAAAGVTNGRMYGFIDNKYVTTAANGVVTAYTKGHKAIIQPGGSFQIFDRATGKLFISK